MGVARVRVSGSAKWWREMMDGSIDLGGSGMPTVEDVEASWATLRPIFRGWGIIDGWMDD